MSTLGVAGRLARREVVRRPWRSAIVLFLVAVPVVVLSGIVVIVRTTDHTWIDEFDSRGGTEDARMPVGEPEPRPDVNLDPLVLPAGTRTVTVTSASERIRTVEGERLWGDLTDRPLDDPISEGLIDRLEGRTPRTSDEVLLTPRTAAALGVAVGDILELDRPSPYTGTVVGIAEWGGRLSETRLVVGTSDDPDAVRRLVPRDDSVHQTLLIDLPDEHEDDVELAVAISQRDGETRLIPRWWKTDTAQQTIIWTWVGTAVAFAIVGIVIAAAFAVTARRQLRLIGQLMANGADRRTLLATLFLQGTVVGLLGGIVGVATAMGGMHLFQPLVERLLDQRVAAYDVRVADLVPIVGIAIVAATAAAMVPARSAIRTTVLQALAGRPPITPYPARLVVRGATAMASGLALLAVATGAAANDDGRGPVALFVLTGIAGGLALLFGTCAITPAVAARLGPLAGSLRGTARLATRSIARQRTRTGAVLAAIAVVAAGAVAGTTAWLTAEHQDAQRMGSVVPDDLVTVAWYEGIVPDGPDEPWFDQPTDPPAEVVAELTRIVPDAVVVPNQIATAQITAAPGQIEMQVVSPGWADAVDLHADLRQIIDEGAIATIGWGMDESTPIDRHIVIVDPKTQEPHEVRQFVVSPQVAPRSWSPYLVAADTARALGVELRDGPLMLHSPEPLTGDQRDALSDLSDDLWYDYGRVAEPGERVVSVHIDHPHERFEVPRTLLTAAVVGVAALLTLAVVGLGLALSAAETKDERDVLAAVGARPATLRRLASAKALILAITGTVIGVPLGFVPVAVMLRVASSDSFAPLRPVFPWVQVALLVVAVPLVAAAVTTVASGLAMRVRPVTASRMAFD